MTKLVEFSEGLRTVLQKYCEYRRWSSVAPETATGVRELITRAGSTEETLDGLHWFFTSKHCDDWVIDVRPELALSFLIDYWHRYEIYKAEFKPRRNYTSQENLREYQLMAMER